MRLLCGKLTFCRHSIVPYILANWLPVLPSTSWCAKVSLHGTILGQMSHPQAEDLFCQAHVTFPNTGRQPPILVDSKSVLIVFIVDGALFLFQLLFDLQCSSMGGTKRVLFACVSVCVCVRVFIFRVFLCVWKWVSLDHMPMGVFGKNYWDNNCSCFFRAWPSHSYETISPLRNVENHSRKIFHVTEKTHTFNPQLRYRFRTKCSSFVLL